MKKFVCMVLILISIVSLIQASIIYLKNGDIIKGEILSMDSTQVKVKTEFAVLTIKREDIKNIDFSGKTPVYTEEKQETKEIIKKEKPSTEFVPLSQQISKLIKKPTSSIWGFNIEGGIGGSSIEKTKADWNSFYRGNLFTLISEIVFLSFGLEKDYFRFKTVDTNEHEYSYTYIFSQWYIKIGFVRWPPEWRTNINSVKNEITLKQSGGKGSFEFLYFIYKKTYSTDIYDRGNEKMIIEDIPDGPEFIGMGYGAWESSLTYTFRYKFNKETKKVEEVHYENKKLSPIGFLVGGEIMVNPQFTAGELKSYISIAFNSLF